MDIVEQLNWRYATKVFDSTKKISDSDWKVLEESLRLCPSSYGLQPWKFFIVQSSDLRVKLKEKSWNQSQVTDCSHYVVIANLKKVDENYITKFLEQTAKVRGLDITTLEGYKKMMIGDLVNGARSENIKWWAQKQTYIAMGFLMETAAMLKIDSCPLEGLNPKAYDQILGLENSEYETAAAVALGYRDSKDDYQNRKKVRFDTKDIIEFK